MGEEVSMFCVFFCAFLCDGVFCFLLFCTVTDGAII